MDVRTYLGVEDLEVYRKLCRLHIEVCNITKEWPPEEKYELASQVRRSSNSAPAQLAEKNPRAWQAVENNRENEFIRFI